MSAEHSILRIELERLFGHLGRLEGGLEQISDFNRWFFQNALWEERSSDETLLDLGADIESILYQWQDFADIVTAGDLVQEIDRALEERGFRRHLTTITLTPTWTTSIEYRPRFEVLGGYSRSSHLQYQHL